MIDFREKKIKILSEGHSKAFQEAVFKKGGCWHQSGRLYQKGANYIFVNKHLSMSYCDGAEFFQGHYYREIQFPLNNMTTFETAKIGDRVWCMRSGWGEIRGIHCARSYPISVYFLNDEFKEYTADGFYDEDDIQQTLFWDEVVIEAPVKPLPDLVVGAKVLVWDNGYENGYEHRVKRHFSHFKNGDCHTFDLGHTSWTGGSTTAWDNWELAE